MRLTLRFVSKFEGNYYENCGTWNLWLTGIGSERFIYALIAFSALLSGYPLCGLMNMVKSLEP
ncbi:hypothetical protein FHY44_14215 [Bacillus sp. D12]|uniref:hypothetical protein n=1 Tax=unclassified Bacillus (in: firmicutes) TaxID=185979 RepID=UPI00080AD7C2|nr:MULTISPECIES: hypothetical protein [unclassified Bacillus (in: firmicutes)]OCA82663.1 hypothetical protein A8L44_13840 [Bacillus sp. FJAT-27986]TPF70906.1 hypothetical protein FHY44_14215 [Bacillus sp. D12]